MRYKINKYENLFVPIFYLVCFCIVSFTNVNAQNSILDTKVNISIKNKTLYQGLTKISKKIGYYFSYNADEIKGDKIVTLNADNEMLQNILVKLLDDSTFRFKVLEKQIIIFKPKFSIATISKDDTLSYFKISGKIVDHDLREPLPFANIFVSERNIGTISNIDGEFMIKISKSDLDKQLQFSYLGYKNYITPIIELNKADNLIILQKDYISIQEVIIRHAEPLNLIRHAKRKIPDNYSSESVVLTSFYRETIRKNNDYVSVSEAILNVFKAPYRNTNLNDKIKIFKSRKSFDHNMDTVAFKIKSGLNTTILLDIVKNPIEFLREDYYLLYDYRLSDIVMIDNSPAYQIDFEQKKEIKLPLYKGEIYIDANSLAIKRVSFSLNPYGIKKYANSLVIRKSRKIKVKTLSANYLASYRKVGNTYYLNHVRCELGFKVRKRKQFSSSKYYTLLEMAVNDIDTVDIRRFKNKEVTKSTNIFADQIQEYDESFWGKHNYIKPDEPLSVALNRINLSLQKAQISEDKKSENTKGIARENIKSE